MCTALLTGHKQGTSLTSRGEAHNEQIQKIPAIWRKCYTKKQGEVCQEDGSQSPVSTPVKSTSWSRERKKSCDREGKRRKRMGTEEARMSWKVYSRQIWVLGHQGEQPTAAISGKGQCWFGVVEKEKEEAAGSWVQLQTSAARVARDEPWKKEQVGMKPRSLSSQNWG